MVQETRLPVRRFYSRAWFTFLRSSVPCAQVLQQPHESQQFIPSRIRDGAILQIPDPPKDKVIAAARHVAGQGSLCCGPAEDVDDVQAVPIDDDGSALMFQVINTPAAQFIALCLEVRD